MCPSDGGTDRSLSNASLDDLHTGKGHDRLIVLVERVRAYGDVASIGLGVGGADFQHLEHPAKRIARINRLEPFETVDAGRALSGALLYSRLHDHTECHRERLNATRDQPAKNCVFGSLDVHVKALRVVSEGEVENLAFAERFARRLETVTDRKILKMPSVHAT